MGSFFYVRLFFLRFPLGVVHQVGEGQQAIAQVDIDRRIFLILQLKIVAGEIPERPDTGFHQCFRHLFGGIPGNTHHRHVRAALTAKFRQGGNILHCQAIGKHLTDLLQGFIEGPDQLKAAVPEQVVLPDKALAGTGVFSPPPRIPGTSPPAGGSSG